MTDQIDDNELTPEEPVTKEEVVSTTSEENTTESSQETPDQTDELDDVMGSTTLSNIEPESRKVVFNEQLKVTQPLEKDVPLAETLGIIRESNKTIVKLITSIEKQLEVMGLREAELANKLRKQGKMITDKDGNLWYRAVSNSLSHAQINLAGEESLVREDSQWEQIIEVDGKPIRPGQPKQSLKGTSHTLEERLLYLSRKAGTGTVFDVPLYHSGVWLRLSTPPLVALTSLQHQVGQLKVTLGNDSKGMAFSNVAQTITTAAVDFALQYVIDANVNYTTPSDLKEKIKVLDIPVLLWGLAVTIYPKGFPYAHPCIADLNKCQYITKELLNLSRLLWTDSVSLSTFQRKIMARRFDSKLTEDELRQYQNDQIRGNKRLVWFGDVGVTLKVPNIQEYEEAGRSWIDGIISMTQGAFNEPPHGTARDNYITNLGISTTARQYTHWVVSVHERDDENGEQSIGDDEEIINAMLDHIFSSNEYQDKFLEEIKKYMDDSIISMIAIPSFNCPNCNSPAAAKFHERFAHLVPIDVLNTFFTLVSQKLS